MARKAKTLDQYADELREDGFRVQRDEHGTITAYERGDRPADTTGALVVDENGQIDRITLSNGETVKAHAKEPGDHPATIARINLGGSSFPVRLVEGELWTWHGVDEDGEDVLKPVAAA
jgi:hypothetical protein